MSNIGVVFFLLLSIVCRHSHMSVLKATMARSPWMRTPKRSVRAPSSHPCGSALSMSLMLLTSGSPATNDRALSNKEPPGPYASMDSGERRRAVQTKAQLAPVPSPDALFSVNATLICGHGRVLKSELEM